MKRNDKVVTLRVPAEVLAGLDAYADKRYLTRNALVVGILAAWVNNLKSFEEEPHKVTINGNWVG